MGPSGGNLRRVLEDFGPVHGVPLQDVELGVGELARLVEHLGGRLHLADVVHQRGQTELAQQRPVDPEPARLSHREDRHVHHVGEGVVVVVLERRQRQQRSAVLRHGLGERVDEAARRIGIRLAFDRGALPEHAGHARRVGVELLERRHVADALDAFLHLDASDADVGEPAERVLAGFAARDAGDRVARSRRPRRRAR